MVWGEGFPSGLDWADWLTGMILKKVGKDKWLDNKWKRVGWESLGDRVEISDFREIELFRMRLRIKKKSNQEN